MCLKMSPLEDNVVQILTKKKKEKQIMCSVNEDLKHHFSIAVLCIAAKVNILRRIISLITVRIIEKKNWSVLMIFFLWLFQNHLKHGNKENNLGSSSS